MLSALRGNSLASSPQNSAKPILVALSGGVLTPPTTVTFAMSPYQVLATDTMILIDTSGGAVVLTLEAAPANGRNIIFKRITVDGNLVTWARNGKLIEGAAANWTDQTPALITWNFSFANPSGSWWLST